MISQTSPFDSVQKFILQLKKQNYKLDCVYDIGAYKGEFTRMCIDLLPSTVFYLFEGNSAHKRELDVLNCRYFMEVLSDSEKIMEWYSISGTGDSLYRENQKIYESVIPELRKTKTLDSIVDKENLEHPDLMKLDVQGAELSVLRGGVKSLANCSFVLMEVPILEYNSGAPKIQDYLDFMVESGFIPIEILEVHKASEVVIQIDIAFSRKEIWQKSHNFDGRNFLI